MKNSDVQNHPKRDLRSGLLLSNHLSHFGAPTVWESGVASKQQKQCRQNFDMFIRRMETDEELSACFHDLARDWQEVEENRRHYGGFFKNYFRNREDVAGYDDKIVWQASGDFLNYFEVALQLLDLKNSKIHTHVLNAQRLLCKGTQVMTPIIETLAQEYPELRDRLMPQSREMPVTIRFMRYRAHPNRATNPHVDKTVLSTIIWNSDPAIRQGLSFRKESSGSQKDDMFQPVSGLDSNDSPAYTFWGAALSEAGYELTATPHAVEPVINEDYRYSIAVFWLLPEFDMTLFNTLLDGNQSKAQFKLAA